MEVDPALLILLCMMLTVVLTGPVFIGSLNLSCGFFIQAMSHTSLLSFTCFRRYLFKSS